MSIFLLDDFLVIYLPKHFFLNSCSTIWMYNSNGKSNFFQPIKHKDCWGEILCINKLWTFKSKYILSYLTSDNAWPTYPPSSDTIRWALTYLPTLKSDAICGCPLIVSLIMIWFSLWLRESYYRGCPQFITSEFIISKNW